MLIYHAREKDSFHKHGENPAIKKQNVPGEIEPPWQIRQVVDILLHCLDGWKPPDMGFHMLPQVHWLIAVQFPFALHSLRVLSREICFCACSLRQVSFSEPLQEVERASPSCLMNSGNFPLGFKRNFGGLSKETPEITFIEVAGCHLESFMQCEAISISTTGVSASSTL